MQLATSVTQQRATSAKLCAASGTRNVGRVRCTVRASASSQQQAPGASRREILAAGTAAALIPTLLAQRPALADGEYAKFLGYATPPTSYGGYGGNANEQPKYSFEYPVDWKAEVPSKVEKGTQGVDGRVVYPKGKDTRAFVITLGRAGEDNASFRLTDLDSTFAGFAGADYALQDSLSGATNIERSQRESNGIRGGGGGAANTHTPNACPRPQEFRYLSSIAVKDGKVFALFVRSPARAFGRNEPALRHIVETFELL
ncbi:hypothetical protein Rsub_06384 [Raphidocelis subcapitata]|uniref:PsbP C-terminal domain-containing protein n=1 Tax=Raphidocelis subcapitata TaxID=307507 RepID=A0A2V0P0E9_9CHLO|nr:hypothetical protein Rsub_06384 [Raphidocelis subcapitata]|eukprot:GBF93346.1 hypothetical protein Rsub_06384 [Raphidocelis subcapitata]